MSFRDRFRRSGSGGQSVIEYASIEELVTASEVSLVPGYYEVTAGVPVTHPQYPRVLTYWDGAAFAPQISTGFENRPSTANEFFVWDALEGFFRQRHTDGERLTYLSDLVTENGDLTLTALDMTTRWRNKECSDEGTANSRLGRAGISGSLFGTVIVAGSDLRSTTGASPILAANGKVSASQGISLFNRASSVDLWNVGWWSSSDTSAVAPRSIGDVAILSWDATSYDLWVNGAKILTRSTGMTINPNPKTIELFGSGIYHTANTKVSFYELAETRIDDAAAAAWTAWLQERYNIPPL